MESRAGVESAGAMQRVERIDEIKGSKDGDAWMAERMDKYMVD